MGLQKQSCPICGATNPIEERTCAICGARLTGQLQAVAEDQPSGYYDFKAGEDDLMTTRAPGGIWMAGGLILLGMLIAGGVYLALTLFFGDNRGEETQIQAIPTDTLTPDSTLTLLALTPQPTLTPSLTRTPPPPLPSVTPTVSFTPTEGPCEQVVGEGDTLYDLALRCGHRDLAVVDVIADFNNLACNQCIQPGQVIQVPRPTPTIDPAILENPSSLNPVANDALVSDSTADLEVEDLIATRQVALEPTLDPNLQYHTVIKDQTLYDIVALYNIDVKLLSEINPEMDFPQCDFGERFGGPTCAVFFVEGQRIRVPAPTATPTIPPTPSGSETPTPTPTATINVPTSFMPAEGAAFDAASIVTLRWTTTGTLGRDEVYAVHVTNLDTKEQFMGITCDLAFDLPPDWQANTLEFQNFEWYVNVNSLSPFGTDRYYVQASGFELCDLSYDVPVEWISKNADLPDVGILSEITLANERYPTTTRHFTWQGQES